MRVFASSVALAVLVASLMWIVPSQAHDRGPPPHSDRGAEKLASELCVAAIESGAYAERSPEDMASYCVSLALLLRSADYTTEREE